MSTRPSLLALVIWYFFSTAYFLMPPGIGAFYVACLIGAFITRYMRRSTASEEYASEVGLYPLRSSWTWIGGAIVAAIALYLAIALVYGRVMIHQFPSPHMISAYLARPWGWLPYGIGAVLGAGILEEFIFRGVIQHALYRRVRPVGAIVIAAALFALSHPEIAASPVYFLMGVMAGVLVYRSRSIWAGVLLHACNNLAIVVLSRVAATYPSFDRTSDWVDTWILVLVAVTSVLCFAGAVRRIEPSPLALSRP